MLVLNNLSIKRGNQHIIHNINLEFSPAKMYGILGPNGTGKSSLLRAIFGEIYFDGNIFLMEEEFSHKKSWKKKMGYMHQDLGIDANLSALEIILLGDIDNLDLRLSNEKLNQALEIMDYLKISHLANRDISSLSGGQKQMVFFAQVLFRNPKVLLLDEPVSALDMHHQCILLECLRQQTRKRELITLTVLHDLSLASEFCDEVIFLHKLGVQAKGLPAEILEHSLLQDIYQVNAKIFHDDCGIPAIVAKSAISKEL